LASDANTTKKPEQVISPANLFPLDGYQPVVCFRRNGHVFRHIFRRLTAADDLVFYQNLDVEPLGGFPRIANDDAASLLLYQRAILSVEGYRTRDGRKPEEFPNWPNCIPQHHRLHAIDLLMRSRGTVTLKTARVAPDRKSVSFVATLKNQDFGVIHHFCAPTPAHEEQFLRAIEGTPSSHKVLVKLYDELIERVEGYSIGGRPISPDQARSEMYSFHKILAVSVFLSPVVDPERGMLKRKTAALPIESSRSKKPAPLACAEVD